MLATVRDADRVRHSLSQRRSSAAAEARLHRRGIHPSKAFENGPYGRHGAYREPCCHMERCTVWAWRSADSRADRVPCAVLTVPTALPSARRPGRKGMPPVSAAPKPQQPRFFTLTAQYSTRTAPSASSCASVAASGSRVLSAYASASPLAVTDTAKSVSASKPTCERESRPRWPRGACKPSASACRLRVRARGHRLAVDAKHLHAKVRRLARRRVLQPRAVCVARPRIRAAHLRKQQQLAEPKPGADAAASWRTSTSNSEPWMCAEPTVTPTRCKPGRSV